MNKQKPKTDDELEKLIDRFEEVDKEIEKMEQKTTKEWTEDRMKKHRNLVDEKNKLERKISKSAKKQGINPREIMSQRGGE